MPVGRLLHSFAPAEQAPPLQPPFAHLSSEALRTADGEVSACRPGESRRLDTAHRLRQRVSALFLECPLRFEGLCVHHRLWPLRRAPGLQEEKGVTKMRWIAPASAAVAGSAGGAVRSNERRRQDAATTYSLREEVEAPCGSHRFSR
jgi:hypothetical protein